MSSGCAESLCEAPANKALHPTAVALQIFQSSMSHQRPPRVSYCVRRMAGQAKFAPFRQKAHFTFQSRFLLVTHFELMVLGLSGRTAIELLQRSFSGKRRHEPGNQHRLSAW